MKHQLFLTALSALLPVCLSCSSSKKAEITTSVNENLATISSIPASQESGVQPERDLPKAIIYKTNGDYNNNVPVTLSADRTHFISFPAPTDINVNSSPLPVADGYLLDRRGISQNSTFLNITYKDYAALKRVPSIKELRKMIIPGAKITEIHRLPITLNEAVENLALVDSLIQSRNFE